MVSHPSHYEWSSYRANAEGKHFDLITPHGIYLEMGPDQSSRAKHYRALFDSAIREEDIIAIRQAAMGGFALGGAIHHGAVETRAGRRSQRLRHSISRVVR